MTKFKIIFSLFFLLNVVSTFGQKVVIDKVISKIGGELILLSELEEQYAYALAQQQGNLPEDARCVILEQLLSQKLLLNQAKLDSVVVSDDEVESQMNARFERILQMMGGDTEQFTAFYGESIPKAKETMRNELKNKLLTDRMQSQVLNSTTVTPSEVKAFFNKIPKDSLPYFNSEVEIREIVMAPEVNAEQDRLAREKLEELRQRIMEGGEDFADLARKFSDDPGSARQGGNLGMTKRGSFVPEFEAAAYNLEELGYSKVIKSEFGYHFIQLLERRGNAINTRHILIKPKITDEDLDLTVAKLDSVRNLVASDSISFSLAVKRYSNDKVQSFNNDGLIVNPQTQNAIFEVGDLEPDIYFTIDTMEVGDISSPIEYLDPRGEKFFRIIMLQSRTDPHKASLETDYSKIQTAAVNEKKSQFIENWVEEKIDATFINIENTYRGCPNLNRWIKDDGLKP
ncbi:MAG: peptidylprolyl isomerase [Bacteroidota bacterium]